MSIGANRWGEHVNELKRANLAKKLQELVTIVVPPDAEIREIRRVLRAIVLMREQARRRRILIAELGITHSASLPFSLADLRKQRINNEQ